jgi:hypothetical protein
MSQAAQGRLEARGVLAVNGAGGHTSRGGKRSLRLGKMPHPSSAHYIKMLNQLPQKYNKPPPVAGSA